MTCRKITYFPAGFSYWSGLCCKEGTDARRRVMAMSQISVNDLSFCYDGSCDMIFKHVSFQVDTDWKLGFTGRNGCGRLLF